MQEAAKKRNTWRAPAKRNRACSEDGARYLDGLLIGGVQAVFFNSIF
jgi:hypothetical protein